MPKNHHLPIQILASKADLRHVPQIDPTKTSGRGTPVIYNIPHLLETWGLHAYTEIWLTVNDTADFPALFDDLYFIATNPLSLFLSFSLSLSLPLPLRCVDTFDGW